MTDGEGHTAIASPSHFIRSGVSAERRNLERAFEWRLSAEGHYVRLAEIT
jgi:hypothetical protein